MNKPIYPTHAAVRNPICHKPTVAVHEDIDWRNVTVAEAIDEERERNRRAQETLARVRAGRRPGRWDTFLQMMGVRRVRV